ncbi:MAG: hypothetical protein GXX85_18605 [Ignavibacteria bacterium]|nr:hypothetical protein [Ignavibacteria bacterium]
MKKIIAIFILLTCLISCSHFKEQLQQQFQQPSLINSASRGNISEIKVYIQSGANINEQDKDGYSRTPLMHAIANSKMEAAKYLINAGANLKIRDYAGFDALIIASEMGNDGLEVIDMLLDKGADINSKDENGWTPLMHTVGVNNSFKTARLLIKRGADLTVKDLATSKSLDDLALYYRNPGLAAEFKEAMSRNVNDVYDSKIVFIRESNPLMLTKYYIDIEIDGRRITMNLSEASFDYIDIRSGKHDIVIKGGWFEGSYKISLDAQSGETYYFELNRRAGNVAAGFIGAAAAPIGGAVGIALVSIGYSLAESSIKGDKAGPVEIIPLEESVAKEKIKVLSKTNK